MLPRRRTLLVATVLLMPAFAAAQPIAGQVRSLGFQGPTGPLVRAGQWFPIIVDLKVQGTDVFSGELRFEGIDIDGDRVSFTRTSVTVSPSADGRPRSFQCFGVVNSLGELPACIDVVSAAGETVAELSLPRSELLLNDNLLVLDISAKSVAALNQLRTAAWRPGERTDGGRDFYRDIVVSKLAAKDLPDHWWGLEAVDVIVWDLPSPKDLSTGQLDALVEWVRNGGQLIIGVGPEWAALREYGELAAVLPLAGEGPPVEAVDLPVFRRRMLRPPWANRPLEHAIPATTAGLAEGAQRMLGDFGPGNVPINLIAMRLVGSGRVVSTAASLRDLTREGLDDVPFFSALLDLNTYTKKFKDAHSGLLVQALADTHAVYPPIAGVIGFQTTGAIRGLLAFLFVGGYIAVATIGSWAWLRGRKATHASWAVFGGFAVVASALSLVMVMGMRGFSRGVQSLNVLDLEAGGQTARGFCWFGYRSPIRQRVRLSLPGENDFLRPLARGPEVPSYYVTPARYASVPARGRLDDVLMRATLKQLEGFWEGTPDGTIRGSLTADRATGRLTRDSTLTNELPVRLSGGYLLYIDPRHTDGLGVPRPANLTVPWDHAPELPEIPPAENILAVRVDAIPAGERAADLGVRAYAAVDRSFASWAAGDRPDRKTMPDLPTLWEQHIDWRGGGPFAADAAIRALLMASTRNFHLHNRTYLPGRARDYSTVAPPLTTDGLPDLDICHWLLAGQAVLLAWTDEPGPAELCVNGKPQESYSGVTMYRVRIPLHYVGTPPSPGGTAP